MKITSDMIIDDDKLEDIDNMGECYDVLLNGDIANLKNQGNHFGAYQHINKRDIFGANQDDEEDNPNVDDGDKESINNDIERDQIIQKNNNNVSEYNYCFETNQDFNDSNLDHGSDGDFNDGSDKYLDNSLIEGVQSV